MRQLMKKAWTLSKYEETLLQCFLFNGFDRERLVRALSGRGEIVVFAAGETIFSPDSFRRAVGIFLQGKAQAEKNTDGRAVVLNRFGPPMMFGAAAVFCPAKEYVTCVKAKTRCRILFLTDRELDAIFQEDFLAAKNYISFLSERIGFLNRKIDSFTKGSAEEKMALYLHDQCAGRKGSFCIDCSPGAERQPRDRLPGVGPVLPAGIHPAGRVTATNSGPAGSLGLAGYRRIKLLLKKGKSLFIW